MINNFNMIPNVIFFALITNEITEIRTDLKTNVLDEDQSEFHCRNNDCFDLPTRTTSDGDC